MQAEYNGVKKSMLALLCSLHPRPLARFLYAGVINGEASPKNDLGRSSTSKFSHGQSDAPKIAARLQAPAAAVHGIR